MSDVTVKYNGRQIAALDATGGAVLKADGKKLKTDIQIDYVKPAGDLYTWLGENAELVKSYAKTSTLLSNTGYNTWTPSTTAQQIVASSNLDTQALDLNEYEYALVWRFVIAPDYTASAVNTARVVKNVQILVQFICKRPSNLTNLGNGVSNGNAQVSPFLYAALDYYNNNSSHTVAWSASYGIYIAATAPTFSNSTSNTPTLTIKTPTVSARCSGTYFSTTNASAVRKTATAYELDCKLYRFKKGTSNPFNVYQLAIDAYRNGI